MHADASILEKMRIALMALAISIPVLLTAQEEQPRADSGTAETLEEEDRRINRLGDQAAEEWEMDLSMPKAPDDQPSSQSGFDLPDEAQNMELQNLLNSLATQPGNKAALTELETFLDGVLNQAGELATEGRLDEMAQLLRVIRYVNPQKTGLAEAFQHLEDLSNVEEWLEAAFRALDSGRIIAPEDSNALFYLQNVLSVDPHNQEASAGMLRAQEILVDRAIDAAQELDFELAEEWLFEASLVRESQELVEEAQRQVKEYQAGQIEEIERDILLAIDEQNFEYAEFMLIDLIALVGNEQRVQSLRTRLQAARIYGQYTPGQVIQDKFQNTQALAPAVVVIKSGSFLMGSAGDDRRREDNEGPQHRVTIKRGFALGQHEVTVSQFREFVESSRFRTQAETIGKSRVYDEKSGRITERDNINWNHNFEGKPAGDDDPVLHVDWYDAQAYIAWLSRETGKRYRLPTEAEFEYAIRGGTVTRYWWGDDRPREPLENLAGMEDESESGRIWSAGFRRYKDGYWGPAPVGSFVANPFGIYDMAGNVSEWVEDCWHPSYSLAPDDGSAWVNPGCDRRVVRGGYWASSPDDNRSAARISARTNLHGPRVGFRLARDL